MAVYIPKHFGPPDRAAIARAIHDYPFATLVSARDGEVDVSHLPLVYIAEPEPHGTLVGHFARANPHWARLAGTPAVAIFQGPHHYVSPSWYQSPEASVPTWNYVVVHAHGEAEIVADRHDAERVLSLMVARFEAAMPQPWRASMTEERLTAQLAAIVAFRLRLRRIDAKFKLGQNRSSVDRERVATALAASGTDEAAALAEWMRRYGVD